MEYNYLGNTGLKVSNICLGSRTFGERVEGPRTCSKEESFALLDEFVSRGGNIIDTAGAYEGGNSERIVGEWLSRQEREKIVVATKVRYPVNKLNPGVNSFGLSRSALYTSVNSSLERLQTEYIDLLQMHCWDFGTPIEETLSTLNDLVRMGKVRYLGCSNLTGWQIQKIADLSRERGWVHFASAQQQWNLMVRETELEVIDVCRNEGIGILVWGAVRGGWLTGKFERGMKDLPVDTRVGWVNKNPTSRTTYSHVPYDSISKDEKVWSILDTLKSVAKETGKTCSQVAIRWLLQKDVVSSVVIGVTSMRQLRENMAVNDWSLNQSQMEVLDKVSAINPLPYPYNFNKCNNYDRIRHNQWK